MFADVLLPLFAYYALRAFGFSPLASLTITALPSIGILCLQWVRRRSINSSTLFVLMLVAVGTGLAVLTGSPQFLMAARGSVSAAVGIGLLLSMVTRKPLLFSLALSTFDALPAVRSRLHTTTWNVLWEREPTFRRGWWHVNIWFAVTQIISAALRIIMAYSLPIDIVPLLSSLLGIVSALALFSAQAVYFERLDIWRMLKNSSEPAATSQTASPPEAAIGRP
ncbi:VC0807 family protein [Kibdelosporangium aridum]|uniref:VC0807 family protein n=1 Tax=Kibdelosporangium aridum TaxID=2030 RepID=UPI000527A114